MSISVLVADDSPTIRRRAQATLGDAGFEVHCVEDGAQAWSELDGGRRPDVILCDILMPKLDGYDLCSKIKEDGRFGAVPVLLLRGTFEPWDENRAHEAGADGFITKPFEPENLVGTVRDVLENMEAETAEPGAAAPPAAGPADDDDPFGGGDDEPAASQEEDEGNPLDVGAPAPAPAPVAAAAPPVVAASTPASATAGELDDAALDALATKVAAKLAGDVLEKLAWEVVPEVAEALVRKRMVEIEAKLQGG